MEIVIIWLLFGVVAMAIANSKGRSGCGWFIGGILLGPFSLVVALLPSEKEKDKGIALEKGISGDYKKCPFCAEAIRREAVKCRYCQSEFETVNVKKIDSKESKKNIDKHTETSEDYRLMKDDARKGNYRAQAYLAIRGISWQESEVIDSDEAEDQIAKDKVIDVGYTSEKIKDKETELEYIEHLSKVDILKVQPFYKHPIFIFIICCLALILIVKLIEYISKNNDTQISRNQKQTHSEEASSFDKLIEERYKFLIKNFSDNAYDKAEQDITFFRERKKLDYKAVRYYENKLKKIYKLEQEVKPIPVSNAKENLRIYKLLLDLAPENEKYKRKVEFYEKRVAVNIVPKKTNADIQTRKKVSGESCYQIGYRYGLCATKSLYGLPCRPENDIVTPERCRNDAETNRGIKNAAKYVYKMLNLDPETGQPLKSSSY